MDDFTANLPEETVLLVDSVAYPGVARLHKNVFYTVTLNIFDDNIIEYFFKYFNLKKTGYSSGGTVADYSLNIAFNFGFNDIYFSGLDLSFPKLQTHAKGTPFFNRALFLSDYFETEECIMLGEVSKRNLKEADSSTEEKVLSDIVLQNYGLFLEKFSEVNKSLNIYYSSTNGLKINNFKIKNIEELISGNDKRAEDEKSLFMQNNFYIKRDELKNFYDTLANKIHDYAKDLDQLFKKSDFDNFQKDLMDQWKVLFDSIYIDFPFLKKFAIMTDMILQGKEIFRENPLWFKHMGHKTLQSIYFIIRILQKILKKI